MNLKRWLHTLSVCAALVVGTVSLVILPGCGDSTPPKTAGADKDKEKKKDKDKDKEAVSGKIKSVGSDTMIELMGYWGEGFRKQYPNVQIEVEGKGSGTAPPALIEGLSQFGPMSRPMKKEEIDKFEKKFNYPPTALETCVDTLAIYVHKDNPLKSLTLPQLDAIFSKTRKQGYKEDIKTWGDLGLEGEWKDKPINLYGRNSASGTNGFLKEHVMLNGDYKDTVKEQPGSSAVVTGVAEDKYAIGYSGIGYKTADVNALSLATKDKSKAIEPNKENAYSGDYPLTRLLYVYINYDPNSKLDPLRREFIRYMFSKEGQKDVERAAYYPITEPLRKKSLKAVGIEDDK
jgi:phosphate transport system substrate-binding protein